MDDFDVQIADGVARVVMQRMPVNALTLDGYARLGAIFAELGEDIRVRCVALLSASPRAFCAGKDFDEFLSSQASDYLKDAPIIRRAFEAIRHCAIPTVAIVEGPALGAGCVVAAACDIRIASPAARFSLPEINVGRCGGGAHIGRLIPQGAMRRMFFSGLPLSGAEAFRLGLVDELIDDAPRAGLDLAATIATKSRAGLVLGKKALNQAEDMPVDDGYALEQAFSAELSADPDAQEAIRAVIEKRAPKFADR